MAHYSLCVWEVCVSNNNFRFAWICVLIWANTPFASSSLNRAAEQRYAGQRSGLRSLFKPLFCLEVNEGCNIYRHLLLAWPRARCRNPGGSRGAAVQTWAYWASPSCERVEQTAAEWRSDMRGFALWFQLHHAQSFSLMSNWFENHFKAEQAAHQEDGYSWTKHNSKCFILILTFQSKQKNPFKEMYSQRTEALELFDESFVLLPFKYFCLWKIKS